MNFFANFFKLNDPFGHSGSLTGPPMPLGERLDMVAWTPGDSNPPAPLNDYCYAFIFLYQDNVVEGASMDIVTS